MARREWAERVEKVAKTLFDLTHSVSDIHEYGWPGWANECVKRDYRAIAEWHLKRLDAVLAKDAMAAKEQLAALQARVQELEARCQRAPLDHETVCHACDGSGWVERGY